MLAAALSSYKIFYNPTLKMGAPRLTRPRGTPIVHGHLLMTVSAVDCSMGDKTQKEKHKKDLQYEAKRKAAEHENQENREAQYHPISGHPASAEHPASSGTIEVKGK